MKDGFSLNLNAKEGLLLLRAASRGLKVRGLVVDAADAAPKLVGKLSVLAESLENHRVSAGRSLHEK
jgi:hypothetical protein